MHIAHMRHAIEHTKSYLDLAWTACFICPRGACICTFASWLRASSGPGAVSQPLEDAPQDKTVWCSRPSGRVGILLWTSEKHRYAKLKGQYCHLKDGMRPC